MATKPLHESQRYYKGEREMELRQQYPKLDGGAFFSIDCIENYELLRELSSFGKDLLVLSPADIQQKVRDCVAAQFQAYHQGKRIKFVIVASNSPNPMRP